MLKESIRTRSMKGLMRGVRFAVDGTEEKSKLEKDDAAVGDPDENDVDLEDMMESADVEKQVAQELDAVISKATSALGLEPVTSLLESEIERDARSGMGSTGSSGSTVRGRE